MFIRLYENTSLVWRRNYVRRALRCIIHRTRIHKETCGVTLLQEIAAFFKLVRLTQLETAAATR